MRRVVVTALSHPSVRLISEYNFGQPALTAEFASREPMKTAAPTIPPKVGAPPPNADASAVAVTTLANGVRVVTQDFGAPLTTVGMYAEAGPIFDPPEAPGLSFVLRWALTTSNFDNSLFQVDRNLRARGVSLETTEVRKRLIGARITARRDMWNAPVQDLVCGISAPRFHESDIERFRDTWDNLDSELRWREPRKYCIERVEDIAFYKTPLGNPRRVMAESNDACNAVRLAEQWATYCKPSRLTLVGLNISHAELLAAYENSPYVSDESAPHFARSNPPAKIDLQSQKLLYYPGQEAHLEENRPKEMGTMPNMEEDTTVAIAFPSVGMEASLLDYASATVLLQLLRGAIGEATTAAAVGERPDDGYFGPRFFYSPFSSAGLLGVTLRSTPKTITQAVLDITSMLKGFTIPTDITSAKAGASISVLMQVQSQRDYCDFLAGSLSREGSNQTTVDEIVKAIEKVDTAAVKRVFQLAMSAKPCLFATGSTLMLPSLRQLGW